jgi:hypothetical protein
MYTECACKSTLHRKFGAGDNESTRSWKSHMGGRGVNWSGSGWVPVEVEGLHKYVTELDMFYIFRALDIYWHKGHAVPIRRGLCRPMGFQVVQAPRIHRCRHMKVASLPALCTGRLYPQEISLVLISLRGSVESRTTMRPEGLSQREITMTPSEI